MNETQIQELLESYDRMRELMVRMNANLAQASTVFGTIQKQETKLEQKLSQIENKTDELEDKIAELEKRARPPKPAQPQIIETQLPPLKEFFRNKGLEVIDKRPTGGNLWITGEATKLKKAVEEAQQKYNITGNYGSGRATQNRHGWFTSSEK